MRRLNAKTVELGDTTGKVEATIRGIVPPELKVNTLYCDLIFLKNVSLSQVGRGFKIFSLKIEGGILYLTSRSALVPCSTDDWIDLSKVKCEANNIITSQDLLKLENQSHVSSTLFVKVCNNKYSEYKLLILGL